MAKDKSGTGDKPKASKAGKGGGKSKGWGVGQVGSGTTVHGGDLDQSVGRTVVHGDVFNV